MTRTSDTTVARRPGFFRRFGLVVPITIFIALGALSIVLWQDQRAHGRELVLRHTQTVARQAAIRLSAYLESHLAGVAVLAEHLSRHSMPGGDDVDFASLAGSLYRAQPGFQAINWLDARGVFMVVVPEERNPNVRGFNIRHHPALECRTAFARAEAETAVTITSCLRLLQGGEGFGSYWPVVREGKLIGYVNGVFRVDDVVVAALEQGVLDAFALTLEENGRVIFSEEKAQKSLGGELEKAQGGRPDGGSPQDGRWLPTVTQEVPLSHGLLWTLTLSPQRDHLAGLRADRPSLLLTFTLFVSLLLSGLAYVVMRRTELARRSRDAAMREVVRRRRLETELRRSIDELEAANRAKEQMNRELDAYIYAASHDVRAPLVAVSGLVDILLDTESPVDAGERQHVISRIRHNIQKLDVLVQDMLMVSRSRRLERTSEEVDIAAVCRDVWTSVEDLGTDQPAELDLDVASDLVFRTDPLRFRQIVGNLLSNSLKYRDPNKPRLLVQVIARLLPGDGDRARLRFVVRDNGIGIPPECVPRIFDMFFKASENSFGSGLGLYIVRQHAQALGGEIACERLPEGTEFRLTLPSDPPLLDGPAASG